MIYKLTRHEFLDFLKQPSLWMLVLLPILMSVMVIGLMNEPELEMLLLPSWILFAQVMVGLMIIAPGFIEEKEQKTLDALLVSPFKLWEIIFAKCSVIFLFSILSQVFVYVLNHGFNVNLLAVLPVMIIGAIIFIEVGLIIGLIMSSSKTSAAISSVVMVLLFVTASFYQQLPEWKTVLQFIPSVVVVENFYGVFERQFLPLQLGLMLLWLLLFTVVIHLLVKKELNK
jgi:ABC-2 type transport system permease protein